LLTLLVACLVLARAITAAHAPASADAFFAAGFGALAATALALDREAVLRAPFGVAAVLLLAVGSSWLSSWHPVLTALCLPAAVGAVAAMLAVCAAGTASRDARGAALLGVALAGALSSLAAGVQRFVTWPDALARAEELELRLDQLSLLHAGRPGGLSLSPDLMGSLALAGAVAGLALFQRSRSLPLRGGAGLLVAMAMGGILLSRSAGVGLALGIFFGARVLIAVARGMRGPLAFLLVSLSAALPLAAMLLLGRGTERLFGSAHERLLNWEVALNAFWETPLWGVGFGRFAAAYASHRVPEANVTRYAHSAPLELLVELGALAGGLVLLVVAVALLLLLRARIKGRADASRDVVLAGLCALLARACYDYDLSAGPNAAVLGVLFGVAWLDARREAFVMTAQALPGLVRRRTLLAVALLGAVMLGSLAAAATLLARESVLEPFRGGGASAEEVLALFRLAAMLPGEPQVMAAAAAIRGRELSACAERCEGLEQKAAALVRSLPPRPPPDAWLLRAQLAARRGDHPAVDEAFARALAHDPGHARGLDLRVRWAREVAHPRLAAFEDEARRWGLALPPVDLGDEAADLGVEAPPSGMSLEGEADELVDEGPKGPAAEGP
jgi:hypothetical protein